MPNVESPELLSVNCNRIEPSQKNRQISKHRTQDKSSINKDSKQDPANSAKHNNYIDYILAGLTKQADNERSAKLTKANTRICRCFFRHWVFQRHILLQVNDYMKPYSAPAHAVQEPFKKELERLQQEVIILPMGVDETVE